ncbi:MAG: hypothetical protein IJE88_02900 [Akkermansia sp.]|nr:hypothetical protein [Akkermansia sp.]
MSEEKNQGNAASLNLSDLADFQFGPAWARPGSASSPAYTERPARDPRAPRRREGGERRPFNRDRRDSGDAPRGKGERPQKRDSRRELKPQRELPAPAEGFRVELRPANSILELFAANIQKQKRALPLIDLARVVMGDKARYDLVFMKLENGPMLIHSTKGDQACWLTEAEALAYLWKAPWFSELYTREEIEVEAPKGNFNAVAVCSLGGELIGPVTWHGYQAALMNLYRNKYSTMPLDVFKNRISVDKTEETVTAWVQAASHKTVWKPTREGAADTVLEDARAVEADFQANHYASVYEVVDKVFINGSTPRAVLSPGIAAHVAILSDKTRRFPQMLIPNLCHGMARHHMPIYKWHGNHFTGPSRVRALPADTVLADRMMAIMNWAKENSGKKADIMFAELSGVSAGEDEASRQAATDAHAPYVADMIWLLEQGYIVVTSDNAVWFPKGDLAPEPVTKPQPRKGGNKKGKKAPAPKKDEQPKA